MKIKRLVIENFKSIERIELIEPNPFTVFVGPNGSGKSNIFEALEFVNLSYKYTPAISLFGGLDNLQRRQDKSAEFGFEVDLEMFKIIVKNFAGVGTIEHDSTPLSVSKSGLTYLSSNEQREQYLDRYIRLYISNDKLVKLRLNDDRRLSLSADNLEKVLKRILTQEVLRNEIFEWLELFIPEFKSVEVVANPFSGEETLLWHERYSEKPFTKDLISDGTYNILAILTAVYQSDEPQFLCIEEPENGLHPDVLSSLVNFFRKRCEENGDYVWLNTHSESVVKALTPDEVILVDKRDGATQVKQVKGMNTYSLTTDQAWLTGALGGGLAW